MPSTAKTAGDKAAAGMAEVKAGMSAFSEQVASAKTQLLAFLSINWAAGKAQEMIQIADAWAMMSARLKLATAGQQEFTTAQRELFAIAQRIGVPIQETATLYGRLQQAVRMLGGEQKDALAITESISQALRLSGASATEAQSALLQFGQALASGVLRGEEFNSVVENSPRLAKALADGLDVPIGRLRKMAEEGRLTADVVVNALMSQKDKLATEYAQLPADGEPILPAPPERLRSVGEPGRPVDGHHEEAGRGPDVALAESGHGDAVAKAHRRGRACGPGLPTDPRAHHRLAGGGCRSGGCRQWGHGRVGERESLRVERGGKHWRA